MRASIKRMKLQTPGEIINRVSYYNKFREKLIESEGQAGDLNSLEFGLKNK